MILLIRFDETIHLAAAVARYSRSRRLFAQLGTGGSGNEWRK
jgi:hypothetical protein